MDNNLKQKKSLLKTREQELIRIKSQEWKLFLKSEEEYKKSQLLKKNVLL